MSFKSNIFFLKQMIRPGVIEQFRKLLAEQYLSEEELAAINWQKRMKLLNHAFVRVPYYARTFSEAGLHPQDVKTQEDWSRLPLLTKEHIRNNFNDLIATNVPTKNLKTVTTGGSTGQPLRVLHDKRFPLETLGWRMLSWWGTNPSDDAAFCWREVRKNWRSKLLNDLMWWPTKRIWLDAAKLTNSSANDFIEKFNSLKPVYFQGYTGSIDFVAQYILTNKISMHSPKCLWGTSSPISVTQRSNIEKAFGAPIYDQYGCSEMYWLAAQCCMSKGLHFFTDARHIEFVGDDAKIVTPGATGNVVITDLENFGFPLIRYQNGDTGNFMLKKCECGVNLPLIAPIKGRITDLVRTPDGGAVGGDYITTLFDDFPEAVRSFQLRQAADYSITLFVVPSADLLVTKDAINSVINSLKKYTDGNIPIRYELVDKIQNDRGKTRFVISEIT